MHGYNIYIYRYSMYIWVYGYRYVYICICIMGIWDVYMHECLGRFRVDGDSKSLMAALGRCGWGICADLHSTCIYVYE